MLSTIRRAQPKPWKTSNLTMLNLRQVVMLPRLKIHSILNDKVSFVHQTDVLIYEYSSHIHSVFWH